MSLHGLLSVTIGVPNVAETAAYYADFGLVAGGRTAGSPRRTPAASYGSRTRPTRRLVELRVAVDDPDDLARSRPAWGGSACLRARPRARWRPRSR